MRIRSRLPKTYGAFKTIQKDNHPFRQNFKEYLEVIASLGLAKNLSVNDTTGYIEDVLFKGERIPDIPEGTTPGEFDMGEASQIVSDFYNKQTMSTSEVTLTIVRMTLRLSVKFGTSLQRLKYQIENIANDIPVIEPKPEPRPEPKPSVTPEIVISEPEQTEQVETPDDIVKRLEALAQRGSQIAPVIEDEPEGSETVVTTNPALADFF